MKKNLNSYPWAPSTIGIVGTAGLTLLLVVRVALMPFLRDADTGRFTTNIPAMILVMVALVTMAVLMYLMPYYRVEVPASRAASTGLAGIVAGGTLGACTLLFGAGYAFNNVLPAPGQVQMMLLSHIVLLGYFGFGVLGAIALVRWGLLTVAESGTRRGMSTFGALAPVMWAWCRLAWYEISYASTVGWSEKFYDFLMVIFELLFLFKLARFVSGVGKTNTSEMLFYAFATAMFALSGVLTRVFLYFIGGSETYMASNLAGLADGGIGVLAFVFGWALVRGRRENPPIKEQEEILEEDDITYDSGLDAMFVSEDNEEPLYKQP